MKLGWANGLRGIAVLALLTGAALTRAQVPPNATTTIAAAAMQLTLGQTYRKSAVTEALERLKETLRDEGLYRAEFSAEELPHAETHEMDIVVHVKPGPRARVGAIRLKNNTEYRDAEIF